MNAPIKMDAHGSPELPDELLLSWSRKYGVDMRDLISASVVLQQLSQPAPSGLSLDPREHVAIVERCLKVAHERKLNFYRVFSTVMLAKYGPRH